MRFRTAAPILISWAFGAPLTAQETIEYDHLGECPRVASEAAEPAGCKKRFEIDLEPGEPFSIVIARTTRTEFSYSVAGLEVPPADTTEVHEAATPSDTVILRQIHDDRFGGYVVRIRHADPELRSGELGEATLTVRVTTLGWKVGFSGGFTASGLTDQKFAAVPDSVDEESLVILRDEEREDEVALGIATFVDLYHSKATWAAFSFGLGVNASSGVSYYVGPSFRFGKQGSLTTGLALGGVATLPAGEMEGREPTSPNALSNLGNKTEASWFVAVSYSFLGGGAADLNKPFFDPAAGATAATRAPRDAPTEAGEEQPTVTDDVADAAPMLQVEEVRCVEGTPSDPPADPLSVTLVAGDPPAPVAGTELEWSVGLVGAGELRGGGTTGERVTTVTDPQGKASVTVASMNNATIEIVVRIGSDEDTAETFIVRAECS